MGAVLQQEQHGTVRVIAYASKTFDAAERQYCTTRKELAAVIYALKEFRHYVLGGVHFLLRTDHGALTSLFRTPVPIQQQARYLNFLANYNFDIQHRAGSQHGNSDGLSRRPCGSKKCTRDDWEVNDAQTEGPKINSRSEPGETRRTGPLRSGKSYLKDRFTKNPKIVTMDPPLDSESSPETRLVEDRQLFKTLDLAWSDIRQKQQKDPTLQKVRELLRDPDPPDDVNEFGMDVVHLWSQRKSLTEINGVLHRTFETAEGITLYQQILVPGLLRKKFLF